MKKLNPSIIRTDDQELGHSNNITLPCLFTSPLCTGPGFSCGIFKWGWDINMTDGTSLNLEDQLLQFICPFIQTCHSLHSSHCHFLLGQAGQARKMRKVEMSKKNCSAG